MDITLSVGIIGSLILVLGAAWPEHKRGKPITSTKNWLLAFGGFLMFAYAILNYINGGSILFVILEVMIMISIVLMMLNTNDHIDSIVLLITSAILTICSLILSRDYYTILFIIGLMGTGLGYAFKPRTLRRTIALTLGSMLIAIFSYLEASWIFFYLNIIFMLLSGYYLIQYIRLSRKW